MSGTHDTMVGTRVEDVPGHEGHEVRNHNGMYTICHTCEEPLDYAETSYTEEKRGEADAE